MSQRIAIKKGKNFVHSNVYGPISLDLLAELMGKTAEKADKWNFTRFLVDFRKAKKEMSIVDDYNIAHIKAKEFGLKSGSSKHALIVRKEDFNDFLFVETVFQNAGYILKIFTEENTAFNWLSE